MSRLVLSLGVVLAAGVWSAGAQTGRSSKKDAITALPEDKRDLRTAADLAAAPGAPVDPRSFLLGPEDVLMVRVWREPELSSMVQIRPDGMITLPLVGDVKAAGTTPADVQKRIVEALSSVLNKPEVTVSVQQVRSRKYYLVGEVNGPGVFPLIVPTTVLEALNAAGGLREFANRKNIVILRGDKRLKFNYDEVIKGKNLSQNIQVENGDHIIVK